MRRTILFTLTIGLCLASNAKTRLIENPSFEAKSTGIHNIAKVELQKDETRIHIYNTFLPKWWVQFGKSDSIRDCSTGRTWGPIGIEGSEFGKRLFMPASGDSTIILIYPPLPKTVERIDWNDKIFGIALHKKTKKKIKTDEIPLEVTKWIEQELAKSNKAPLKDFSSKDFFSKESGRLIGYIKGYDPRLGFRSGIIYCENNLTNEDFPTVLEIHPDGRFEAEIPLVHPTYSSAKIHKSWIPFYIEPGQTLSITLDWNEFLTADRLRNIRYQFKNIKYEGPLSDINAQLLGFIKEPSDYKVYQKKLTKLRPDEFNADQLKNLQRKQAKLEAYLNLNKIEDKAACILRNDLLLESGTRLFDFVNRRKYESKKDTANAILKTPVKKNYYDFLQNFPLNENSILIPNGFSSFVNRFEFCDPLESRGITKGKPMQIQKNIFEYLTDKGIVLNEEQKKLYITSKQYKKTPEQEAYLKENKAKLDELLAKCSTHIKNYHDIYVVPFIKQYNRNRIIWDWEIKDSLLSAHLNLKPGLVYEITKLRTIKTRCSRSKLDKEDSYFVWDNLKKDLSHPSLIRMGDEMLELTFPENAQIAYELPEGKATEVFRKIIEPFKGKVLFIDFWATTCGPCVGGIKRMKETREKYIGNKDFDFIFITDERGSPLAAYDKFVTEQELKNTFRISNGDYYYLRQLFKFNGIPRYVVIDKDGKVLNDNFSMYDFNNALEKILKN